MTIKRFEDIAAWQDARELAKSIYQCTSRSSFSRDLGLRDQIQRAAGSVMHNIAEGFDSGSDTEFIRFLQYAPRSCTEVQSELCVTCDQKYITKQQFDALFDQAQKVRAKIGGLIKYILSSTKGRVTKDSPPRWASDEGRRTN